MGPHKYSIWSIGQLKGIFPQVPKPIYYFVLILKMKKIHLTSLDHSLQHIPQCSWDFLLLFLLVCMIFSWSLSRLHRMPSIRTNFAICSNGHAFFWYSKISISCLCIFDVLFPVPCCGQSKSIRHWTFKIGDHSTIQYSIQWCFEDYVIIEWVNNKNFNPNTPLSRTCWWTFLL